MEEKKTQYILYGTGAKARLLWNFIQDIEDDILCWIDSDSQKWDTEFFGKKIYSIGEIHKHPHAYICIAAVDAKYEMRDALLHNGVENERIVNYNELIMQVAEASIRMSSDCDEGVMDKSSILVDCSRGLNLGGLEEWSKSLVMELFKRKHEAFLLGPSGENSNIYGDDRVIHVDISKGNFFCMKNVMGIFGILEHHLPCTVITGSINPFFIAACILKRKYPDAIRLISVIHQGVDAVYKEYMDMSAYVESFVAVSEDIRSGMIRYGCYPNRIFHITCPVQCDKILVRQYSENKVLPIKIAYAGRIVLPQKRMDLLLLLVEELEKRNVNYCFEIAGTGEYVKEIQRFVVDKGLQEKVVLVGNKERKYMPEFWKRQDICINVADHEGRSISIMEAMANGAVPVVTATSGVKEDIFNGVNGYFVDLGNYTAIADKIEFLENNREKLKIMGTKAHEVISQKSNMDIHIEFWENLLRRLR